MNWYIFLPSLYLLIIALIMAFFQGADNDLED
jgi:hypothetical protein